MLIKIKKVNKLIESIEKLSKIPLINNFGIAIITLAGVYYGYYLTVVLKEKKETKKILDCIHYEIIDNLSNPSEIIKTDIAYETHYKVLTNVSGNIFRSKIGNLTISPEQIQSILKIYQYFDSINDEIINMRKNSKFPEVEIICNKKIENYYSDCKEEINKYQERWKPAVDLKIFDSIDKIIKK